MHKFRGPDIWLHRLHWWGMGCIYAEVLKIAPANHPALLPLYGHAVAAGFPSPADNHLQAVISLDEELIDHPVATFMAWVKGNSMRDANICDGDVLIVDRATAPAYGHLVIAAVDGELTVKRLWSKGAGSNSCHPIPTIPRSRSTTARS